MATLKINRKTDSEWLLDLNPIQVGEIAISYSDTLDGDGARQMSFVKYGDGIHDWTNTTIPPILGSILFLSITGSVASNPQLDALLQLKQNALVGYGLYPLTGVEYTTTEKNKLGTVETNLNYYTLPTLTNTVLGGVMPYLKDTVDTQQVRVDIMGRLWTLPGGGLVTPQDIIDNTADSSTVTRLLNGSGKVEFTSTGGSGGGIPYPTSQQGESTNRTLVDGGTFKVLSQGTTGLPVEHTLTLPLGGGQQSEYLGIFPNGVVGNYMVAIRGDHRDSSSTPYKLLYVRNSALLDLVYESLAMYASSFDATIYAYDPSLGYDMALITPQTSGAFDVTQVIPSGMLNTLDYLVNSPRLMMGLTQGESLKGLFLNVNDSFKIGDVTYDGLFEWLKSVGPIVIDQTQNYSKGEQYVLTGSYWNSLADSDVNLHILGYDSGYPDIHIIQNGVIVDEPGLLEFLNCSISGRIPLPDLVLDTKSGNGAGEELLYFDVLTMNLLLSELGQYWKSNILSNTGNWIIKDQLDWIYNNIGGGGGDASEMLGSSLLQDQSTLEIYVKGDHTVGGSGIPYYLLLISTSGTNTYTQLLTYDPDNNVTIYSFDTLQGGGVLVGGITKQSSGEVVLDEFIPGGIVRTSNYLVNSPRHIGLLTPGESLAGLFLKTNLIAIGSQYYDGLFQEVWTLNQNGIPVDIESHQYYDGFIEYHLTGTNWSYDYDNNTVISDINLHVLNWQSPGDDYHLIQNGMLVNEPLDPTFLSIELTGLIPLYQYGNLVSKSGNLDFEDRIYFDTIKLLVLGEELGKYWRTDILLNEGLWHIDDQLNWLYNNMGGSGWVPELPTDGRLFGRQSGTWTEIQASGDAGEMFGLINQGGGQYMVLVRGDHSDSTTGNIYKLLLQSKGGEVVYESSYGYDASTDSTMYLFSSRLNYGFILITKQTSGLLDPSLIIPNGLIDPTDYLERLIRPMNDLTIDESLKGLFINVLDTIDIGNTQYYGLIDWVSNNQPCDISHILTFEHSISYVLSGTNPSDINLHIYNWDTFYTDIHIIQNGVIVDEPGVGEFLNCSISGRIPLPDLVLISKSGPGDGEDQFYFDIIGLDVLRDELGEYWKSEILLDSGNWIIKDQLDWLYNNLGGSGSGTVMSVTGDLVSGTLTDPIVNEKTDTVHTGDLSGVAFSGEYSLILNPPTFGSAAFSSTSEFATLAQGLTADLVDLAVTLMVAGFGDITSHNISEFATAAQGLLLENAIPLSDIGLANGVASLGSDGKVPAYQLPTLTSGTVTSVTGSMVDNSIPSTPVINSDSTKLDITSLDAIAFSGEYTDLKNVPDLINDTATSSTLTTLSAYKIMATIGGILGGGLPVPEQLGLESNLPNISSGSGLIQYYVIQNMDVTNPGHQGRLWCLSGDTTWSVVYDELYLPDNVDIVLNLLAEQTLSTTGVAPGAWTKVIVDNKGRVTSGSLIGAVDLPSNIPQNKIASLSTDISDIYGELSLRQPKLKLSDGTTDLLPSTIMYSASEIISTFQTSVANWTESNPSLLGFIKNKPLPVDPQIQSDWDQTNPLLKDYIKNKPTIDVTGANLDLSNLTSAGESHFSKLTIGNTTGKAADGLLAEYKSNKQNTLLLDGSGVKYPTVDAVNLGLSQKIGSITGNIVSGTLDQPIVNQVPGNWTENTPSLPSYIRNKPVIPLLQIQSDWAQILPSLKDYIKNKPDIPSSILNQDLSNLTTTGALRFPHIGTNSGDAADAAQLEFKYNKQNSLNSDGSGIKYPTVDAVNYGLTSKPSTVAGILPIFGDIIDTDLLQAMLDTGMFITGTGGQVNTVVLGNGIIVDSTDPVNPRISATAQETVINPLDKVLTNPLEGLLLTLTLSYDSVTNTLKLFGKNDSNGVPMLISQVYVEIKDNTKLLQQYIIDLIGELDVNNEYTFPLFSDQLFSYQLFLNGLLQSSGTSYTFDDLTGLFKLNLSYALDSTDSLIMEIYTTRSDNATMIVNDDLQPYVDGLTWQFPTTTAGRSLLRYDLYFNGLHMTEGVHYLFNESTGQVNWLLDNINPDADDSLVFVWNLAFGGLKQYIADLSGQILLDVMKVQIGLLYPYLVNVYHNGIRLLENIHYIFEKLNGDLKWISTTNLEDGDSLILTYIK